MTCAGDHDFNLATLTSLTLKERVIDPLPPLNDHFIIIMLVIAYFWPQELMNLLVAHRISNKQSIVYSGIHQLVLVFSTSNDLKFTLVNYVSF